MARRTNVVQHLLLATLLCCSSTTFAARILLPELDTATDTTPLPGIVVPATAQPAPTSAAIELASQEQLATATAADIAQAIPPLYSRMLARHNTFRMRHGAENMTWDAGVAATAKAWAQKCKWEHSGASGVGENLYAAWLGTAADLPRAAMDATNAWYKEVRLYKFNNPGFTMETGHFTQVVWKATTKLGCFAALCNNLIPDAGLMGYVVCNYSPPGNFGGPADYRVNVQPARRRRAAVSATAATAAAVNVEAGTTP